MCSHVDNSRDRWTKRVNFNYTCESHAIFMFFLPNANKRSSFSETSKSFISYWCASFALDIWYAAKNTTIFLKVLDKLWYKFLQYTPFYTHYKHSLFIQMHTKNVISHARAHSSVHTPFLDVRSIVNGSRQSLVFRKQFLFTRRSL